MATLPPLPTLFAFEAVARRRSFALAANEMNLTASAISHQIARLESFLGVKHEQARSMPDPFACSVLLAR